MEDPVITPQALSSGGPGQMPTQLTDELPSAHLIKRKGTFKYMQSTVGKICNVKIDEGYKVKKRINGSDGRN